MKTSRIFLIFFALIAWSSVSVAQDVVYSQFYANPVYLNPALAGGKLCNRLP
jgi:hypothetical protein